MFLNSWSLTLCLCSLVVFFLLAFASRTAVRVLRFWNPASDSNRQIRLENEIWLSSTMVAYGLGFQIVSLLLFVLAANHYCQMIVGAMCATGALTANSFGVPALMVKVAGVFLYGFWIVMHQLDIRSERYPLVRVKYIFLLLLLPLLFVDISLQTLYISGLKPDIITSCCAVVFSSSSGTGSQSFLANVSQQTLLVLFYSGIAALFTCGILLLRYKHALLAGLYSLLWMVFFGVAIVTIIAALSSYIYAMPYHNCPFCIFKTQYYYIGFAIFGTLIPAVFLGISLSLVQLFLGKSDLVFYIRKFQTYAVCFSLLFLTVFAFLSSYHYIVYKIMGGEV